ncbi:unnamed protein product [Bathycoccus prasinos]
MTHKAPKIFAFALLPARANATTNTSKNNNNSSTTFRILKGTTNKKSRAKRNSFVRQAAESVGPCVVRVDALMPSPSSSQKEQQQQQKEQQQQREDEVTFTDGRTYIADVKGVDQTADIALKLNLRASHVLPSCDIGNSDEVTSGIGRSPWQSLRDVHGVGHTRTTKRGILPNRLCDKPGNSGGPLVNEFSELSPSTPRQDAEVLDSIPINTVRRVAEALSRGEIIARPYLG